MKVEQNTVVTIEYTLKNDAGDVLDSSDDTGGMSYLHGHQNIVPGLEKALDGKDVGEKINTTVNSDEGYGKRQEELVFNVPRDRLPEGELEVGMQFRAQAQDGQEMVVHLVDIGDDEVTLDGNHPLAGEDLHFDVTVTDVRGATEEEISHGHVHDGTHHH
ncbi:MAG: peptidylprolyl isomerase [Alkalispirochaeta sp.]|jgi:FKBP-type peptidyl-prolyl cis-trans isomerase SlyD